MNDTIERIALAKIVPDPRNRKASQGRLDDYSDIMESIRLHGVQQPALVRPLPDDDPRRGDGAEYELVFGERRWRASALAGLGSLPCMVKDLTPAQAVAIQLIENVHRKDINPLDEADAYLRLRDECGYTVDLIAQETGRSAAHVYQSMRLGRLIPEIHDLLLEGRISKAAAMPVARLDEAQQKLVFKAQFTDWNLRRGVVAHDVEDWIRENLLCDLKKVAWKMNDAGLVKKAGACSECAKRTGADPALFTDVAGDNCTDPECFKAKAKAILAKNLKSLEGTEYLAVKADYGVAPKVEGALNPYQWTECKKSDEGAVRAILINGTTPGKLIYAKKVERTAGSSYAASEETPEEKAAEEARQKRSEARAETNRRLFDLVMKAYREASSPVSLLLAFAEESIRDCGIRPELAGWYGWKAESPEEGKDEDEALEEVALDALRAMTDSEILGFLLASKIDTALMERQWGSEISSDLVPYLELYRIDGEEIRAAVFAELGVPLEANKDEDEEEAPPETVACPECFCVYPVGTETCANCGRDLGDIEPEDDEDGDA